MKRTIEVTTKQIKTFSFDVLKVKEDQIDKDVNKFLSTIDGDEMEIAQFPIESNLVITIVYDLVEK